MLSLSSGMVNLAKIKLPKETIRLNLAGGIGLSRIPGALNGEKMVSLGSVAKMTNFHSVHATSEVSQ